MSIPTPTSRLLPLSDADEELDQEILREGGALVAAGRPAARWPVAPLATLDGCAGTSAVRARLAAGGIRAAAVLQTPDQPRALGARAGTLVVRGARRVCARRD